MTVRAIAGSVLRPKLTAVRLGVFAILASAALAGCSPSSGPGTVPPPTGTSSSAASGRCERHGFGRHGFRRHGQRCGERQGCKRRGFQRHGQRGR